MGANPWHKRYHSDALTGYRGLTLEQRGAYSTCLDLLYDGDSDFLPASDRWMAGQLDVSVRKWRTVRDELVAVGKLILTDDGRVTNGRFLRERGRRLELSEKRAEAGQAGGKARAKAADADLFDASSTPENTLKTADHSSFSTPENAVSGKDNAQNAQELSNDIKAGNQASASNLPSLRARVPDSRYQKPELEDSTPTANQKPRPSAVDAFDLIAATDRMARLAGVPHSQPTKIAANIEMVRGWVGDGIDLEEIVVPIIERFRLDKPDERLNTLRFFDGSVRAKVAANAAKGRGGKPHRSAMSAPPVKPLAVRDQVDERVATIRKALNGKAEHAPDAIALSVELDGDQCPTLVITARSSFAASRIDRDLFVRLASEHLNPVADIVVRHP